MRVTLPLIDGFVLSETMITRSTLPLAAVATLAGIVHAQQAPGPLDTSVPANPNLELAIWPSPETSPSYADIASLERRMRNAAEPLPPAILMALGHLKTRLDVDPK